MRFCPPDHNAREAFHQGRSADIYHFLGAHPVRNGEEDAWHFAVWAPNARSVAVTGEFCAWRTDAFPMEKHYDGIWETRLPASLFAPGRPGFDYPDAAEKLTTYKYAVTGPDGCTHLKADPYGVRAELRPNTASRLYDLEGYDWQDGAWMAKRAVWNPYRSPVNIYEMHLGTWRRREDGTLYSYRELCDQLIPYLRRMGYTHVELLPVMEHPLDGSWGYQVTGYFAPTARYGSPRDFMTFVDRMHRAGIGVILDWVPAHFPRDEQGLMNFDGTPCYEHADPRRADMPQWGTRLFDYSRGEVCSFLLSNACYWLDYYHADGLRCDAVSGMLYLDFCKEPGQWLPNPDGSRENRDAIAFIRRLNTEVYARFPGVMMIAEESSAFPGVTAPADRGGLGFGFKWNMGWMNDMLSYIKLDPVYRKYHHDKLTFSLCYAFNENYVLPFSHDEVVHGKHSMLDKQPGDIWRKFAGLRALYGFMIGHPGKKLLFMGEEFGQFIEWKDDDQLDWFLLLYEKHPQMQAYVRALNHLYRSMPALYARDDGWEGFTWLSVDDCARSCVAFMRMAGRHTPVVCAVNFTPVAYRDYPIGLPFPCEMTEVLNSDWESFAGSGQFNGLPVKSRPEPACGLPHSAHIVLGPHACVFFKVKKTPSGRSRTARK